MRINLRKINQLIREEYERAKSSAEKSATSSWPFALAREYFPNIEFGDAMKIARGDAALRWNTEKHYIEVVPVERDYVLSSASETQMEMRIHAGYVFSSPSESAMEIRAHAESVKWAAARLKERCSDCGGLYNDDTRDGSNLCWCPDTDA